MISKVAVLNGQYTRISLTEDEKNLVMDKLLENNMDELDRIIKRLARFNSNEMPPVEIVKMLFDKQGTSAYTILSTALDEKVSRLKDEEHNKNIILEPAKPAIRSMIDDAFDRSQLEKGM